MPLKIYCDKAVIFYFPFVFHLFESDKAVSCYVGLQFGCSTHFMNIYV